MNVIYIPNPKAKSGLCATVRTMPHRASQYTRCGLSYCRSSRWSTYGSSSPAVGHTSSVVQQLAPVYLVWSSLLGRWSHQNAWACVSSWQLQGQLPLRAAVLVHWDCQHHWKLQMSGPVEWRVDHRARSLQARYQTLYLILRQWIDLRPVKAAAPTKPWSWSDSVVRLPGPPQPSWASAEVAHNQAGQPD